MTAHAVAIGTCLFLLSAVMLGCSTSARTQGGSTPNASSSRAVVTILHTNDLHGHLTAWRGWEGELDGKHVGGIDRAASVVARVRKEAGGRNVLLLDAGDAIGDTMLAAETQGQAVLKAMEAIRYDAMTIGNHEPDFTAETLRQHIRASEFPILVANVLDEQSGNTLAKPFIVQEIAGVKVGVLGLAYPNTPLTTAKKNISGLQFRQDSAAVVKEYLPQMRKAGAQFVVVLSHLGLGADKKLAENASDIDVIVGGHSHNRMSHALRVGNTLIVQAGAHGSDVGRLDLIVEGGRVVDHRRELILLDHATVPSEPQVAKLVESFIAPLRAKLDQRLGEATTPIVRAQTLAGQEAEKRDQQSPADNLFADILREKTGSDIALLPGVGYGVAILPGPITAADLRNLIPHESKVVTMTLSGTQVQSVLEQSVENTYTSDPVKKVGGMIQVSGLTFAYDPNGRFGERVRDVKVGGVPLETDRRYAVGTNTMLAAGGHSYSTFTEGRDRSEHAEQFMMVRSWIIDRGKVATSSEKRVTKLAD